MKLSNLAYSLKESEPLRGMHNLCIEFFTRPDGTYTDDAGRDQHAEWETSNVELLYQGDAYNNNWYYPHIKVEASGYGLLTALEVLAKLAETLLKPAPDPTVDQTHAWLLDHGIPQVVKDRRINRVVELKDLLPPDVKLWRVPKDAVEGERIWAKAPAINELEAKKAIGHVLIDQDDDAFDRWRAAGRPVKCNNDEPPTVLLWNEALHPAWMPQATRA